LPKHCSDYFRQYSGQSLLAEYPAQQIFWENAIRQSPEPSFHPTSAPNLQHDRPASRFGPVRGTKTEDKQKNPHAVVGVRWELIS
jgi:hypothetical protein